MKLAPVLRAFDLLMIGVLLAVVFWTFKVKNDSQVALEKVAKLERQIEAERIEIGLLKSDWSLLTSPVRLEQLVVRYERELQLEPMVPSQLASESDLQMLKKFVLPTKDDPEFAGTDSTLKTGSIHPVVEGGGQ